MMTHIPWIGLSEGDMASGYLYTMNYSEISHMSSEYPYTMKYSKLVLDMRWWIIYITVTSYIPYMFLVGTNNFKYNKMQLDVH